MRIVYHKYASLVSGPVFAVCLVGVVWTLPRSVRAEVEPSDPHVSLANRWKVSSFTKVDCDMFARDADFSWLGTVTKKTDWENGASVDSFYGFSDGAAFDCIRQARATAYIGGLYAIQTNGVCGLAVLGVGERDAAFFLPVELDAPRRILGFTLDYRCWQPKIGMAPTTLSFHWCAVDSLEEMEKSEWVAASDGDYSGGGLGPWRTVRIPGKSLGAAKFVCFRWSVRNQANSSLLGISDLRVTADVRRAGLSLQVR